MKGPAEQKNAASLCAALITAIPHAGLAGHVSVTVSGNGQAEPIKLLLSS